MWKTATMVGTAVQTYLVSSSSKLGRPLLNIQDGLRVLLKYLRREYAQLIWFNVH